MPIKFLVNGLNQCLVSANSDCGYTLALFKYDMGHVTKP